MLKQHLRPLLKPYLESENGDEEIGEDEWDRMMKWKNSAGSLTISGLHFSDKARWSSPRRLIVPR